MEPGSGDSTWLDRERERYEALRRESQALGRRSVAATASARAIREQMLQGRARRAILHDSAFARLLARQETMPVIEQAKGILMYQQGCGPQEAFDLLRRASQRANVKARVLAAQIVEQAASGGNASNVTPIALGATKSRQARTRLDHRPVSPPPGEELPAGLGQPR